MIRIGIVGFGYLGRIHLAVLQELTAQFHLVGVYDRNPIALNDLTNAPQELVRFNTYQELLDSVDAVAIIASTPAHYELAQEAILAGKAIFVEKPMCATLGQAQQLAALVQAHKCLLQVGHVERFNPALLAAEPYFAAQQLQTFTAIRTAPFQQRGAEVSVVLDLMIHDLDLLLTQVTGPLRSIEVEARCVHSAFPDAVQAILTFADGIEATIFASRCAEQKQRSVRVQTPQHFLELDLLDKKVSIQDRTTSALQLIEVTPSNSLQMQWLAFANAYHAGQTPEVGAAAGLRALELAFEIEARASAQIAQNSNTLIQ